MNKLLTCSKSLDLVNNMIKDCSTAEVSKQLKEVCSIFDSRNLNESEKVSLLLGYFSSLKYGRLTTERGICLDVNSAM